ncbi:PREDICTED: lysM and putative peptidoglycan-binding domain-containing protein 4-like [Branchiostoma belcheri]|uniref:LysM and putative peptidoglycan-binding domain-containing protein 4-like n=1 Tax=Branchiostoma belcheri TaxID=7741 RepID=A0A6P4YQS4_BRABE|nr:PREDICTED: lysM and putative peptidoglycan-binding domain-containing protein 4-like [Branchiostoma belcheri]XP_019619582.1 PREDICTED: lysM and putative peptidoglycan-binding domain-containing protein 4-like [Branchiostoma belcheri]
MLLRRSSHDKMAKAMAGGRRARHTSWNAPNAELGNLYVFGDDVEEEELLEEDAIEMRPRGERRREERGRKDESDTVLLDRTIMPGDTLQTFALLYGCTLADLRRANNLMSDQDFHALKTIKVPVKRHGLLTAREEEDRRRRQFRRADSDIIEYGLDAPGEGTKANGRDAYAEMNDIRGYLTQMDEEMDRIRRSTPEREETFEPYETRASLMECRRYINRETSNGADGGIRWWMALLCMIIVAVVCPLLYFLYFHSRNDATKKP